MLKAVINKQSNKTWARARTLANPGVPNGSRTAEIQGQMLVFLDAGRMMGKYHP